MKHEAGMQEEVIAQDAAESVIPDVVPDALPNIASAPPAVRMLAEIGDAVSDEQASKKQRAAAIVKGLKRGGIVSALTGLLYWVLLSPPVAMSSFYNHVLFVPSRYATQTKTIAGLPVERVTFASLTGKKLTGWYINNPGATKTILFSHGNGGNMDAFVPIMENAIKAGASLFAYDYQGYGASEGEPSLSGVIDDAQAAYDYLVNDKHVQKEKIVFYGVSLGTGVTTQLLKRRPAAGVILMSPFTNIIAVAREHLRWLNLYPDFMFPAEHLEIQSVLEKPHPPVLVIHGKMDHTVLFHHAEELQKSSVQPMQYVFVDKAAHNDLIDYAGEQIQSKIGEMLR